MSREIKIKKSDGKFHEVKLTENYKAEFCENLDLSQKNGETIIRETREYELITPLFGGGAETKKADEVSVIRATEIRGHLRFWWRATRGGQFNGNLAEMKKHEDAIFGSTDKYSALQIEVEKINGGKEKIAFWNSWNNYKEKNELKSFSRYFEYISFPLQPENTTQKNDSEWKSSPIFFNNSFRVKLSYPISAKNEIQNAFWFWENLGGVGARTRRGFGAFKRIDSHNKTKSIEEFSNEIQNFINLKQEQSDFPILNGSTLKIINFDIVNTWKTKTIAEEKAIHNTRFGNNKAFNSKLGELNASELVWCFLTTKLQNFRQSPRTLSMHKGRSSWSEPDAIRRITGNHATENPRNRNSKDRSPKHPINNKFPRANFGLPIEFKFNDNDVRNGDPDKKILEGKNKDQARLTSPLILRPVICKDGIIAVALVLNTPRKLPKGIHLKGYSDPIEIDLELSDIAHIQPMQIADPKETDVLKSFLKYLEK